MVSQEVLLTAGESCAISAFRAAGSHDAVTLREVPFAYVHIALEAKSPFVT